MSKKRKFSRQSQWDLVKEGLKGCSKCGEVLKLECFQKQKNLKIGYKSFCKYCRHIHDRKKNSRTFLTKEEFWHRYFHLKETYIQYNGYKRSLERDKITKIKRTYKVGFKKALELYKKTKDGNCEICNKTRKENKKYLAIDHCHSTGEVRGVLCDMCNKGLGHFNDDLKIIKKSIYYLKRHKDGH